MEGTPPRATFTAMEESTVEDWAIIGKNFVAHGEGLADRILAHLRLLDGDFGGFAVDRLTHSLQTATRAFRAGEDEEYTVCALLHDIGDTLGSFNHADVAAAIVRPFVSDENHWMVEKHAVFQGYYFFHHLGLDRDMRDRYRDQPYWRDCAEFCARYDQNCFDPSYDTMPLDEFRPMVKRVFSQLRKTIYSPGVVKPA